MNKKALRSVMALHGDTNKTLAEFLGMTVQAFSYKINERTTAAGNKAEFKQGEIALIRDRYKLNADDVDRIFFN